MTYLWNCAVRHQPTTCTPVPMSRRRVPALLDGAARRQSANRAPTWLRSDRLSSPGDTGTIRPKTYFRSVAIRRFHESPCLAR
jgi:hypothetical protein